MSAKEIKLSSPVELFGKPISRVSLKEPRGNHLLRFGEPRLAVFSNEGANYWADRDDAISQYLDNLLSIDGENPIDGGGVTFVYRLGLADAVAIKEALFSFFFRRNLRRGRARPRTRRRLDF
jgi:hypothetical protein